MEDSGDEEELDTLEGQGEPEVIGGGDNEECVDEVVPVDPTRL